MGNPEEKPISIQTADGTGVQWLTAAYAQLRKIAAAQMARMGDAWTLQPTALVHEAWLRFRGSSAAQRRDRAHFVSAAAEAMRHILIDRARRRRAVRHGGEQQRVDVEQVQMPGSFTTDEHLLVLDEALRKFESRHPDAAALVKLRCFGGLDIPEAGRALGLTRSAAYRRWLFARAWLQAELSCESS